MGVGDWSIVGKVVENIGVSGLWVILIYRLANIWAARFLDAQKEQAHAMSELASAVKDSMGDQREVLLAVRVLATKQDETRMWIQELAQGAAQGRLWPSGGGVTS
ncbi:MAG: hypothetical protein KGL39_11375 [Patescibacteria group bacterium]|nr:hypothetical protein [Patescibacteria group bacterium]